MSPRARNPLTRFALLAVAVAVLVAAAAAVVVFARGEPTGDLSAGGAVRVKAVLSPRPQLFGDTLTARVEVAADTDRVDPASIRVQARFRVYRPVTPPTIRHRTLRGAEYISWTATLRCLEVACLPGEDGKRVTFPSARVTYSLGRDDVRITRTIVVRWPSVLVYPRVDAAELAARDPRGEPPWRADLGSLPQLTYRSAPGLVAAVVYGLGGILIVGALVLLGPLMLPLISRKRVRTGARLPPLEQALVVLESDGATDDNVEARRQALELVALELGRLGERKLELSARQLAWSADPPPHEDTRVLAESVRGLRGERSNGRGA